MRSTMLFLGMPELYSYLADHVSLQTTHPDYDSSTSSKTVTYKQEFMPVIVRKGTGI